MLEDLSLAVRRLYEHVDAAVLGFQQSSGLRCPRGCVFCCYSEKVEATVLEMLPLAFHLFRTGQAELLFKRLERLPDSRRCILFHPNLAENGPGGCSHYAYRVLVCRLFGFAGSLAKDGSLRLSMCRIMRDDRLNRGTLQVHLLTECMPLFSDFGQTISAMHPDLGGKRRPINEALKLALAKVGLFADLTASQNKSARPGDKHVDPPHLTPTRPRRKAA